MNDTLTSNIFCEIQKTRHSHKTNVPLDLKIEETKVLKYFLFRSIKTLNIWIGLGENDLVLFSSLTEENKEKDFKLICFFTDDVYNGSPSFLERMPHMTKEKKYITDPRIIAQTSARKLIVSLLEK